MINKRKTCTDCRLTWTIDIEIHIYWSFVCRSLNFCSSLKIIPLYYVVQTTTVSISILSLTIVLIFCLLSPLVHISCSLKGVVLDISLKIEGHFEARRRIWRVRAYVSEAVEYDQVLQQNKMDNWGYLLQGSNPSIIYWKTVSPYNNGYRTIPYRRPLTLPLDIFLPYRLLKTIVKKIGRKGPVVSNQKPKLK